MTAVVWLEYETKSNKKKPIIHVQLLCWVILLLAGC